MAYSKSKVDRSGQVLANRLLRAIDGKEIEPGEVESVREAIGVIEWWRREHAKPLSRVAANLRYYVSDEGEPVVAQRLKKFPTLAGKLLREPGMKLSRMADIGGVRAVLPSQDAAYRVASRLRRNWTITKTRDYVEEPKADGYRALHLINRNRGRLVEVQLRTELQDVWANAVERDAREIAPGLKFGAGPKDLREFYIALGALLADADQRLSIDDAKLSRVVALQERIATLRRSDDEP